MDVDPVRWVQVAGAVVGAALLALGLYTEAVPVMWIGGGVLAFSALCVSCYRR